MKLSIIVPYYQVEDYLDECLASIVAQTRGDFECILVDDGSLDGSLAIAQRYVAMDSRFRLVLQENAGLGPARNTGIDHAGGEYLMFVDSDDVLSPRAVQLLVDSLEATGSDIAVGNARRFGTDAGVVQSWTHAEPCAETSLETHILKFISLHRDRMVWNKVYRRSFWDEHEFRFPAIRYEDYPVTLPAHVLAKKVDVFSDPVYFWRDRVSKDSITQQATNVGNALDRIRSANLVLNFLDEQIRNQRSQPLIDLRYWVRRYFIDVDVVAVGEAIAGAEGADQELLLTTAQRWCRRLKRSRRHTTAVADGMFTAILTRDLPFLRALVAKRAGESKALLVHRPSIETVRYVTELGWAFAFYRIPRLVKRRLNAVAHEVQVTADSVTVGFKVVLNQKFRDRAKISVQLANDYRAFNLKAKRSGDKCWVDIPIETLKADRAFWETLRLTCRLRLGPIRWTGPVRFGSFREYHDLGDGLLFGDVTGRGELGFTTEPPATRITGHWDEAGRLVLESSQGDPVVHFPAPGVDLIGKSGRLVVDPESLLADPVDDPISGESIRAITVGGRSALLMSAPSRFNFDLASYSLERTDNLDTCLVRKGPTNRDSD